VSKTSSKSELSLEEEKEAWRRHHIESLLERKKESASLPFSKKIQMLEEMAEVSQGRKWSNDSTSR
jgi:hypothetical protein